VGQSSEITWGVSTPGRFPLLGLRLVCDAFAGMGNG
jgi:hypothetical protein